MKVIDMTEESLDEFYKRMGPLRKRVTEVVTRVGFYTISKHELGEDLNEGQKLTLLHLVFDSLCRSIVSFADEAEGIDVVLLDPADGTVKS